MIILLDKVDLLSGLSLIMFIIKCKKIYVFIMLNVHKESSED